MATLGELIKEEMSELLTKYGFSEPRTRSGNLWQSAWAGNGKVGLEVIFDELEQDYLVFVRFDGGKIPLKYSDHFKGYMSPEEWALDRRGILEISDILVVRAPAERERLRGRMGRKVIERNLNLTEAEQREILREIGRLLDTYASDILAGDQSAFETVRRQAERG